MQIMMHVDGGMMIVLLEVTTKINQKKLFFIYSEQADLESDALSFVRAIKKDKKFPGDYN